jgi:hypothetical protein
MSRIGLIQSRGIGDIIIALPIAKYLSDRGHEVVWPIDARFAPSFIPAVDYVEFVPFEFAPSLDGFLMTPMRLLKSRRCDRIIPLYSYLTNTSVANGALARRLKFDEYKYAVAGVPFFEKWNLKIKRDHSREQALFDRIVRAEKYTVRHLQGSNCHVAYSDATKRAGEQVIDIEPLTENIFDWMLVLEKASSLVLIDSCFSNLVDQCEIQVAKTFVFRSDISFTPVLRGAWTFSEGKVLAGRHDQIPEAIG